MEVSKVATFETRKPVRHTVKSCLWKDLILDHTRMFFGIPASLWFFVVVIYILAQAYVKNTARGYKIG